MAATLPATLLAVLALPQPPALPRSFSVRISSSDSSSQLHQLGLHPLAASSPFFANSSIMSGPPAATFFFDNSSTDGTLRQRINQSYGLPSTAWTLYTPSNASMRTYAQLADDCRPLPVNFSAFLAFDLSWVPLSTFAGEVVLGPSMKANRFVYSDTRTLNNYTLVTTLHGQLLELYSTFIGKLPGTGSVSPTTKHTFGGLVEGPVPASLFDIPVQGCFEKVPPCPNGDVVLMDLYLAHPHQFTYLDNEDTADAKGDVTFLCPDILQPGSSAFNLYDQVSRWQVEIDTHWGQYEQCNGYPGLCFGLEDYFVGRQIPYGTKKVPLSGQCTPNTDSGSWFSHTLGGKCLDGQRPSEGTCTWRPVKREKTIALKCLVEDVGMLTACKADILAAGGLPGPPFTKWIYNTSLKVFQDAFASENPDQGGCPNVALSPSEES
ncbi:hypothetical protein AB1Y20_008493 [Prymnesium parvum]|uniref:Uncharacterized protein n=1 Tax=Prymnesium parvum TaxID=97485 RepID=A0AB34IT98_PRYPA